MTLMSLITRLDKLLQALSSVRLARALLMHRVLAGAEHRHVLCRELAMIVDIGANRGQFALAARQWARHARVIAFEPLPEPARVFRSVFADDALTVLHQCAVGPKEEDAVIHVSQRDDSSSLLPISTLQATMFPNTEEKETQTVRVCPLDRIINRADIQSPALLKLDVQGFELEALGGCMPLLPCFDQVYVECSFVELYEGQALAHQVIDFLRQEGFVLGGVYNMCYDQNGKAIQADFLFKRSAEKGDLVPCAS